jgi:hypothetical protein
MKMTACRVHVHIAAFFFLGLLVFSAFSVVGQAVKVERPAGYLNKPPPGGLRFAAPPKPPVEQLPPLPVTYDPQPLFSHEFAQPFGEAARMHSVVPAPSAFARPPSVEELVDSNFIRPISIPPVVPVDSGVVSPQMLVRFFAPGQTAEVGVIVDTSVAFQPPVYRGPKPSSSAVFRVR